MRPDFLTDLDKEEEDSQREPLERKLAPEGIPNERRVQLFRKNTATHLNESVYDFIAIATGPDQYGSQTYVVEYTEYKPYGEFNLSKDVEDIEFLDEIPSIWIDTSRPAYPGYEDTVYIMKNSYPEGKGSQDFFFK